MSQSHLFQSLRGLEYVQSIRWRFYLHCFTGCTSWDSVFTSWTAQRNLYEDKKRNRVYMDNVHEQSHPLDFSTDSIWSQLYHNDDKLMEIRKDVLRTYSGVEYFEKEETQAMMQHILLIWSLDNATISYRQGMNEILAIVMFTMNKDLVKSNSTKTSDPAVIKVSNFANNYTFFEHDAYLLFSAIMSFISKWYITPSMSQSVTSKRNPLAAALEIFSDSQRLHSFDTPLSALMFIIQEKLLKDMDSELHRHFVSGGILPQLYLLRWIRLLFAREFPLEQVPVVWEGLFSSIKNNDLQVQTTKIAADINIHETNISNVLVRDTKTTITSFAVPPRPPKVDSNYVLIPPPPPRRKNDLNESAPNCFNSNVINNSLPQGAGAIVPICGTNNLMNDIVYAPKSSKIIAPDFKLSPSTVTLENSVCIKSLITCDDAIFEDFMLPRSSVSIPKDIWESEKVATPILKSRVIATPTRSPLSRDVHQVFPSKVVSFLPTSKFEEPVNSLESIPRLRTFSYPSTINSLNEENIEMIPWFCSAMLIYVRFELLEVENYQILRFLNNFPAVQDIDSLFTLAQDLKIQSDILLDPQRSHRKSSSMSSKIRLQERLLHRPTYEALKKLNIFLEPDNTVSKADPVVISESEDEEKLDSDFLFSSDMGSKLIVKQCGYLVKEGGGTSRLGRKSLKKRFFSLQGTVLRYYRNESSLEPIKGFSLDLRGCLCRIIDEESYCFDLCHANGDRVLRLYALNLSEFCSWLATFHDITAVPLVDL